MGSKLLRESSDIPNITNRDDCKMTRYAYGGYTGIVKNVGRELSLTYAGSSCTVQSGRFVTDGWEVDVDSNGVNFSISGTGTVYHSIVVTIILSTEEVRFERLQSGSGYPEVSEGDDLTQHPGGAKYVVTHHLTSKDGVFISAERVVPLIPYLSDLEKRVEELGFKKGFLRRAAVLEDGTETELGGSLITIIKQGKMAVIQNFSTPAPLLGGIPSGTKYMRYYVPEGFKPPSHRLVFYAKRYYNAVISGETKEDLYSLEMNSYLEEDGSTGFYFEFPNNGVYQYYLSNIGWQIE